MKTIRQGLTGAAALALGLTAAFAAAAARPSGDTCRAFGGGTSYSLEITIPPGAPVQRGLAFAAPGTTITNIDVPGADGSPSTTGLPPGTSAQWLWTGRPATGHVTVTLATTGAIRGAFTVVPTGPSIKTRLAPFTCRVVSSGGPIHAFTARDQASYDAASDTWEVPVSVPGPGMIEFLEVFTPTGGPLISHGSLPQQLVLGGEATVARGAIELPLRPTPAGAAQLRKDGALKIFLSVSFRPNGGLPATKILTLILRR